MKVKRNFNLKLLLCCLVGIMLLATLVACDKYKPAHYDYLVTFNYNLGDKISGNAPDVYLGVLDPDKKGSLIGIRPGYNSTSFSEAAISGYYLENWYLPLLDENNELQYDADKKVILADEPFDFATQKIFGDITLYAKLAPSPRMRFIDAHTGEFVSEIDGKKPGERRSKPSSSLAPKKVSNGKVYTFKGKYYADAELTEEFQFPYTFKTENIDVYCEFIEGDWALVSTVREFNSAIGNGANIYLMNDIDFEGQTFNSQNYNAELCGNGYALKNISIAYTGRNNLTRFNNGARVGIFPVLMGRSYVHDVVIENAIVEVETNSDYSGILGSCVSFFAAEARDGARIENVTMSGVLVCNQATKEASQSNHIGLDVFIAQNSAKSDQIVNCDYSGVNLIYLS